MSMFTLENNFMISIYIKTYVSQSGCKTINELFLCEMKYRTRFIERHESYRQQS